jgi:RHS repeat-associated protein
VRQKFAGYERDGESGLDYAKARYYSDVQGRFTSSDNPFAGQRIEIPQSWNLYVYCHDNPTTLIDPDGRSTHTDKDGKVVAVYHDDSFGVYRHADLRKWNGKDHLANKGKGIANMGVTAYWDEFRAHDNRTGEVLDKVADGARIRFGESFDDDVERLNNDASNYDLRDIAERERLGQAYDIKNNKEIAPDGPNTGKLLNGQYATARSAGNYLAGLNEATGTYFGEHISYETAMKLAGALQQGQYGKVNAAKIIMFGTAYGPAPWYGEIEYTGRRVKEGFQKGAASRARAK